MQFLATGSRTIHPLVTFLNFEIVAVVASSYALPAKGSTKAALKKKPCIKDCGDVYKPVCGGDGSGKNNKSFGSECVLSNYNCETGNSNYLFYLSTIKQSRVLALSCNYRDLSSLNPHKLYYAFQTRNYLIS